MPPIVGVVDPSYRSSAALATLKASKTSGQTARLAFLDVDQTWTGRPEDQRRLRQELTNHGYLVACVTNRASELCMSWAAREQSSAAVRERPKARFVVDSQRAARREIDPASLVSMTGLLDLDIIISSLGGEVLIKQSSGGYEVDDSHRRSIRFTPGIWYTFVTQLLAAVHEITGRRLGHMVTTSAASRIQISFETNQEKENFVATVARLRSHHPRPDSYDSHFLEKLAITHLIDESDLTYHSVLVTQPQVTKHSAVDHVTAMLASGAGVTTDQLEVLLAGDGPPDMAMGFTSARDTIATFVIPGAARLARLIKSPGLGFFEQELSPFVQQLRPLTDNRNQKRPGWYRFSPNGRIIVIGDEAFPKTRGPETLLAWLKLSSTP